MRQRCLLEIAADRQAPAIARASALTELGSRVSPSNIDLARTGLSDPDPMVRIGALDMLEGVPMAQRWPLASPLLSDAVQGVRIRAASLLAGVPNTQLTASDRQRFERAAEEFIAAQKLNADRPEARSMLGYLLRAARRDCGSRDRVQSRAAAQPAIHAGSDQSRRSLPSPSDGKPMARASFAAPSLQFLKMREFTTRSA